MAKGNPIQLQKHLKGVDYPTSKEDLIKHAEQNGADQTICSGLEQLPDEDYDAPTAVTKALSGLE